VEREHQIGMDLGGTFLVVGDKPSPDIGATLGVHYVYGLTDEFRLVASGTVSPVSPSEKPPSPVVPSDRPAGLAELDVGLGYVFDVLRWVPYIDVLGSGYALFGGSIGGSPRIIPGISLALGLDYRLDRTWSVGACLRQSMLAEPSTYPSVTQALAHVDVHWGW
jgi:hypothetical protein